MAFDRLMGADPEAKARQRAGLNIDELQSLLENYTRSQADASTPFVSGHSLALGAQDQAKAQARRDVIGAKFQAMTGHPIDEFAQVARPLQGGMAHALGGAIPVDMGTAYADSATRLANWSMGQPTGAEAFRRLYGAR